MSDPLAKRHAIRARAAAYLEARFAPDPGSGYGPMIRRAQRDPAYREGLRDAALIARAQGWTADAKPCPSDIAAVYIERVANGEEP